MTSRERVFAALDHKEADRVPIDFGATMETTIHIKAYEALKEHLGLCTDKAIGTKLLTAQFAHVDKELQEFTGSDIRGVNPEPPEKPKAEKSGEYIQIKDEFGIGWRKPVEEGLYYDMYQHPLAQLDLDEIKSYPFPDPADERRFRGLDEKIPELSENGKYPIVFDNCFGNGIFQMCNQLMGYDQFLMSLALGDEKAFYLLDRMLEMKMEFWEAVLSRFGNQIDIVKELDDMGTQLNLLISPDMYREHIKPRLKRLVDFIKSRAPHVRMMMHSCGSIRKIIPDLIDVGVEILNPLQYTAEDMDPATLKREFGKELTFWGGGIETQKVLPYGSVQDVIDETKKQLDILMPGGGFVFAQVHTLQWGVPIENMLAMWETAREYGVY